MLRPLPRLLAAVVAVSCASCASSEPQTAALSSPSPAEAPPPPPAPPGMPAQVVAASPSTASASKDEAIRDAKTKAKAEERAPAMLGKRGDVSGIVADDAPPMPDLAGGTFVHAGTNPFVVTATDPLSTFAADVDTGSFTFARRSLQHGALPPDAAVRVEEWVNAMHYSYAPPSSSSSVPFAVHVDGAASPISRGKHIVRVALQGKTISNAERGPTHLVFLVDVSGSMQAADKLPLARRAMHMMVDALRADDSLAIVTYAGSTGVVLPTTSVSNKRSIHEAIDRLSSGGGTNMDSGMQLAYREAQKQLGGGRSARVVVLSDGDANIGRTSHDDMLKAIKGYVSEGVMMSTVGFGTGNYNDHLMEHLADAGNGNYTYIADDKTAERFFVDELNGTIETIAQDVKIQVAWNKDIVSRYRLLGYENRDVADADFRNDKKDAGEIGSGHAVTALYELELVAPSSTPYANLGTVSVRAKKPRGTRAEEISVPITASVLHEQANDLDDDAQTAVAVALAAEVLRHSPHADGRTLAEAAALLRGAATGRYASERLELAAEFEAAIPRLARR